MIEVLEEPAVGAPPDPDPTVEVDVRYADDDVIVVAKPAGLVVHPGAGHAGGTLVNGLLARFPEIAAVGDALPARHRAPPRPRHERAARRRRDRRRAYDSLVEQISTRTVDRALRRAGVGRAVRRRAVSIDAPIGRSTARRTRMAVRESGKAARTEYEVRTAFAEPVCSLLDCRLETGRTHQIRVHLSAIGHPVVGDATYGGSRASRSASTGRSSTRPTSRSTTRSPASASRSTTLPPELAQVLDDLDRPS